LGVGRFSGGAGVDRPVHLPVVVVMVVVTTTIVLIRLCSNSHDRSNCENQRLDCHRGFHGVSPSFRLSVVLYLSGSVRDPNAQGVCRLVTHPGALIQLNDPAATGECLVTGGDLAIAG